MFTSKILLFSCMLTAFLLVVASSIWTVSASYTANYVLQDDGTSNHYVEMPSFFWNGSCSVNLTLRATAAHSGTFTLTNTWYSPSSVQVSASNPLFPVNINCLSLGTGFANASSNDFFETRTKTVSSATTTATWGEANYICEMDGNDYLYYTNTTDTDAHGNFPYGYSYQSWACCQISPACAAPTALAEAQEVVALIKAGYSHKWSGSGYCGGNLRVDAADSYACAQNRNMGMGYWSFRPFNSMASGFVNVSVTDMEDHDSGYAVTSCSRSVYLWDTGSDSVSLLSSSTPYSDELTLTADTEYWLMTYLVCTGASGAFGGSVHYDYTDYNMTIWGYEPNWSCNDWSVCADYLKYRTCSDLGGGLDPRVEFEDCFEPPAYTPAEEYTAGTPVYYTDYLGSLLGYHWYDPKVACQENEQHCAILAWNTNLWVVGGGLNIYWSDNGFTGSPLTYQQTVHFPLNDPDYGGNDLPNWNYLNATYEPMPYDIMFYAPDNKYYVITTNGDTNAKLWSYTSPTALSPVWTKTTIGCGGTSSSCTRYYPLGFYHKDTSQPLIAILRANGVGHGTGGCGFFTWALRTLHIDFYYLNGTLHHTTPAIKFWGTGCGGTGFYKARGIVYDDNHFRIMAELDVGAGLGDYFNDTISSGFVSDYYGFTYIRSEGDDFKYARPDNGMDEPEGFYGTMTSDFDTYTPQQPYYLLNFSLSEDIRLTDKIAITGRYAYAYERKTSNYNYILWGTPLYSTGIYFATEEFLPLIVYSTYTDPLTGTTIGANVTVVNVANDGYTESSQGSSILLHTTKRLQNDITFTSMDYLPINTQTTYDVPVSCDNMKFYVNLLAQSYILPIYVFDESENPISGASVSVDGMVYTTDSYGKILLVVSPLSGVTFSASVDNDNCKITYTPTGNPREYLVIVSKTGYKTAIHTGDVFVEAVAGGYSYLTEKSYTLTKGANVVVNVQSKGHVPITGGRVSVTASGMDTIRPTTVATTFPFTFIVINGTYPVNLSLFLQLTGCAWLYNATQQVLIHEDTISTSTTFTLPYSIDELPCQSSVDCAPSYCQGGVFYSLTGCNVDECVCEYSQETCLAVDLCDDDVGCIDETSTDVCRFDSECYGGNQCLDAYTLESWTCGGAGTCVAQRMTCDYLCDAAEKVCIPSPTGGIACDQSTTVGMLTCMRSGMLNFIGPTFDPLMSIGIALALVILVIAIAGLGFKAVSKSL